ncbi:LADA_0C01288g1_1 [Lachancea dasiensis]|uniref:Sister chromatid cohesion protein n=1 Tax=Lachancea dasiensis TaxID=1072105 RepID=A0A1G4IXQ1_9SACH|nr:LADA_0C01288g1_1 [Lachancea dasiensis]
MTSFPGDKTNIPKRLTECLEYQPLNFLIPKSGLCELLHSSLRVAPVIKGPEFRVGERKEASVHRLEVDEAPEIQFREFALPVGNTQDASIDLFSGLSDGAQQFLNPNCFERAKRAPTLSASELTDLSNNSDSLERYNDISVVDDDASYRDIETEAKAKKVKAAAEEYSLDQVTMHSQYLKELERIMPYLGDDTNSAHLHNQLYWTKIGDLRVVSETCLERIMLILKNISQIKDVLEKIPFDTLNRLLRVCSESIDAILKTGEVGHNNAAFKSATVIFMIFLMDIDEKRLYLERYLVSVVCFLQKVIESLTDSDTSMAATADDYLQLKAALSLLSSYIQKKPMQEEQLITKLVYLLSDLLTFNPIMVKGMSSLSTWLETLRRESSVALITMFEKLPTQRIFILDELLFRIDALPTSRIRKKLQKIGDSLYATHLFLTIARMLQAVNSSAFRPSSEGLDKTHIEEFINTFKEQQSELSSFIEHVNNSILNKCFAVNSFKKYILDNYVQDLLAMTVHPAWCVGEILLASLLKKMLLVFSPSHQSNATKESSILQIIANVGSTIQDIKLKIKSIEGVTFMSVYNDDEMLGKVLSSFQNCLSFLSQANNDVTSRDFLWDRKIACLAAISGLTVDNAIRKERIDSKILMALQEVGGGDCHNSSLLSSSTPKDPKHDYFLLLQVSELLSLFDPYVRLVLSLLNRQSVKLRSGAIKCLAPLVSNDPGMLEVPSIKNVIEKRLLDSSSSVKMAILDLLSSTHLTGYYTLINLNYNDESATIRKQVLKLNLDIYERTSDVGIKAFVASRILRRTEDEEDSIIEKAQTSLLEFWFLKTSGGDRYALGEDAHQKEVLTVISTLVGQYEEDSQLFETFLNEYVLDGTLHTKETFEAVNFTIRHLTGKLVDEAILMHYGNDELKEAKVQSDANIFQLLAILSACEHAFISKVHITNLFPYLMSSELSDLQYYILKVFKNSFSKLSYFKTSFLIELESTTLGKLPKMSVREMEEAIPLCWSIQRQKGDDTRISRACASCLSLLTPYINLCMQNPSSVVADGKVQRLLYLAAGFARFCNFTNLEERFPNLKSNEPLSEYVTKCLLLFTRPEIDPLLRKIAFRNLLKVGTSHPKLFNSPKLLGVVDKEFTSNNLVTSLVIVQCFSDLFISEEQKALQLTRPVRYSTLKVQRGRSIEQSKPSSAICPAVASRYLKKVLKLALQEDTAHSCVTLQFIELVLDFGYTNPVNCLPTLICLLGSPSSETRRQAIVVIENTFSKNSSLPFSNLGNGFKAGVEHIKRMQESGRSCNAIFLPAVQSLMYKLGMKPSRFFNAYKKTLSSYFGAGKGTFPRVQLVILCMNMAGLGFDSILDVCVLARLLDVRAEELLQSIEQMADDATNDTAAKKLPRDLIISRECLLELRIYLCRKFGINDETVAGVGTSEDEDLRMKPAEAKHLDIQFQFPPAGLDEHELCNRFWSTQ